jgi:hypothetical protein
MKSLNLIRLKLVFLTLLLCNAYTNAGPDNCTFSVKGANNKEELGEIVFQAVKYNDFNLLLNYIPDEHHLQVLSTNSLGQEKSIYENIDSELIKNKTRTNFDQIIKYGIDNEVNWSSLEITDASSKVSNSLKSMNTVFLTLEDNKETIMSFSFDAMEIENRWFLLQGIRKVNQAASLEL